MPWNPVKLYPDVIRDLNTRGYTTKVNADMLRVSIMRILGTIKEASIRNHMQAMEDLGYLKQSPVIGVFDIRDPDVETMLKKKAQIKVEMDANKKTEDDDPDLEKYVSE